MAQPTITTATQTYQGTSVTCAKIVATDTTSIYSFTNVARANDDYTFQVVMKTTTSAKTVSFTLGGVAKTQSIGTSFEKYLIQFPETDVSSSKDLLMSIPAGTYYVYNLQLERGLHMSEWRPAPEDGTDYTDSSAASTLSSANSYADTASATAAASAVSGMSQQDVFNKLTNNGSVQGIILQNGELYINGAYIQAGTIVSTGLDSATQTKITNGDTANSRAVACRGTCSTGATTAAKVVTSANFALATGSTITVYFSTANTKADAKLTLNVNSTGAKDIYVNGTVTSSTNQLLWVAGSSITFTYNGTGWCLEDKPGSYYSGSCSTAAGTAAKTATLSGAVIFNGVSIKVPMTNANTSDSATLNLNSLGAKNIYYSTTTTRPTTANKHGWIAGRTVTFLFDGAYFRLMESSTIIDGGHIQTGTIDASVVSVTNLNASNITSGTISASKISGGSMSASLITSGTMSADRINGGSITGSSISLGNGKFAVDTNGNVTANAFSSSSATITGGTIKITTASDTSDIIKLSKGNVYSLLRNSAFFITDDNNNRQTTLAAGVVTLKNDGNYDGAVLSRTGALNLYMSTAHYWGVHLQAGIGLELKDSSEVTRSKLANTSLTFYDSSGNVSAVYSESQVVNLFDGTFNYSSSEQKLTDGASYRFLIIVGDVSNGGSRISVTVPVAKLTTSNTGFQIADDAMWLAIYLKKSGNHVLMNYKNGYQENSTAGRILQVYGLLKQ